MCCARLDDELCVGEQLAGASSLLHGRRQVQLADEDQRGADIASD
jgi:hypothetical protein